MKIVLLALSCALPGSGLFACSYPNFYAAEMGWIMEEPFTVECLAKSAAIDSIPFTRLVDSVRKKYPDVFISAQILPIRVDVEERKNSDKAPIVRVMTGSHGKINFVARFEKKIPSLAHMDSIFSSPARKKIIDQLVKNRIVLLVLRGADKEENKRFLACAQKGSRMARDMVNKTCAIVEADLADGREKYLFRNIFGLDTPAKPGVLVLFGKGKGLHLITDPGQHKIVLDMCQMLDNTTNVNSSDLMPRIILNMPLPKFK